VPRRRMAPRRPARGVATLDARLDQALLQTFPASDPIAIGGDTATEPPSRPVERLAPAIDADAVEAVRTQRKPVAGT